MDVFGVVIMGVMGLLIGSFSNVLIWRLPRGENVAFPPSHCPGCNHSLGPHDLVPVLSWAALGGKCRYCRNPISARYPVIELISGLAYAALAVVFPLSTVGASLFGLGLLFTLLLAASLIDIETYTIPDELTLPGVLIGLVFGVVNAASGAASSSLPVFAEALRGALMGAGLLIAIDLIGSWTLRRFREMQYPDMPLGYQQIALGLFAGLLIGGLTGNWWAAVAGGLGLGIVSTLINVASRRVVRVPELLTLGGSLLALALLGTRGGPALLSGLSGALAAAGAVSLLAGVYWWLNSGEIDDDAPGDPRAMGFGDVKLAAVIGAFLGFEKLLVAVAAAVALGAVLGLLQRFTGGESKLKFGPYLALGALIALLWGAQLAAAYRGYLGI